MATHVFKNPKVSINSIDLSDHCTGETLNFAPEVLDETAFGDDTRTRKVGLNDWNVTLELHQARLILSCGRFLRVKLQVRFRSRFWLVSRLRLQRRIQSFKGTSFLNLTARLLGRLENWQQPQ